MALNPSIILAGQSPDIVNVLARSNAAAQERIGFDRQNAMNRMLQEQGAGIIAGDQNAINALAGYSPDAAMGIQESRLGMDATRLGMDQTRQQMAISAEEIQMKRDEGKRMAAEAMATQAANLDAATIAAEQKQITDALSGAAAFYQKGDRAGYDAWLGKLGLDPQEYAFDEFPAHAAMFEGVLEAMQTFAPPAGPEWVAATPEQAAQYGASAGQVNTKTGEFKRTPVDSGTVIETGADGRTIVRQGPGVGAPGDTATVGQVYNPNEIANVIGLIDDLAVDPGLDKVTGNRAVVLGGGNMITEFNLAQRAGYGTDGLATIERIGQLQSNAWLSARQMLKGGGAITDYESKKAEAAVARLERPKSKADFLAALKELRDAITEGEAKIKAAQGGTNAPAAPAAPEAPAAPKPATEMSDEEYLKSLGLE